MPGSNLRWRVLIVCAAVAVVGGALYLYRRELRVPAARVARRDVVQTVLGSGRVVMAGDVELRVKGAGRVSEVLVKEGQHVAKGEALVKLDAADERAALEEAQATVARSLADLRALRSKATPLARSSLQRAALDVQYAQDELARTQKLFAAGAQSSQQLVQARTTLALARTRRDTAQLELASTLPEGADRELAVAALGQAQAALDRAQVGLADAALSAPSAGTVVELGVDPGDSVQPGQLLVRMVADGPVRLELEPDERNLALLRVGQHARASAEAFPDQSFDARLSYIAKAVDPTRGTIRVRFDVPAPPDYLRADMTVSVEITVAKLPRALVVPVVAVRELATKRPWVLVVYRGRALRRDIAIGVRDEALVQVVSGLREGEWVLLDPALAPGARVRPMAEEH